MSELKRYPLWHGDEAIDWDAGDYIKAEDVDAILPRWVPVSERNPAKAKWYTVMIKNEDDQNTGYYDNKQWENPDVLLWLDGVPPAPESDNVCPKCKGEGDNFDESGMCVCYTCQGTGKVIAPEVE